uniref:Accessory gland protein Acp29AB-like n=1 Tax=Drosophila rhopaloa TaxID=1041015 RepID=A0A6P4FBI1_DRORH
MFKLAYFLIIAGTLNASLSQARNLTDLKTNQDRDNTDTLERQVQIQNQMDSLKNGMEAHLAALENKLESMQIKVINQLTAIQETLSIPLGFVRIGSRYFYIEETVEQTWYSAEMTCRRKGGHLAYIRNQEELDLISKYLDKDSLYWLGIHEPFKRGEFVTVTSCNRSPFLKWGPVEPKYVDNTLHCIVMQNSVMLVQTCKQLYHLICQADN